MLETKDKTETPFRGCFRTLQLLRLYRTLRTLRNVRYAYHSRKKGAATMPRTGITSEQVYQAAEALIKEGITPTVHTIRERLGTGSFSTITGYLNAWRTDRDAAQATYIPDPPETVTRLFRDVWTASWKANHETLANERHAIEAARRDMDTERAEMSREIQALETTLEKAEEISNTRAAELDKAKEEVTRLNTRLEEMQKTAEGLRAELSSERQAKTQAGEHVARLETTAHHLENQIQAERNRAERLEKLLAEAAKPKATPPKKKTATTGKEEK
jgi:hypothetical protein